MNTEFLDQLAGQLRTGKSAACRRAIARVLTTMRERCKRHEYTSESEAGRQFRDLIDAEPACQNLDP